MDRQKNNSAIPILLIVAGCALYMVSGGIRSNFGIIVQALADRTGVSYADVSFAVAVGQLMYGVTQPVFGIVAMKRSNGFVLVLGTLLMATGLLLTTLARSVVVLVVTLGLLFFTGTGAVCFGIIMGAISPVLGERRASAASGILNASSGIGGSLLSPLMQALQASLGVGKQLVVLSVPVLILLPICFVGHQIGGFISSWLGGIFITQSGNYQAIWMFDIALCAIAALASYGIHRDVKRLH